MPIVAIGGRCASRLRLEEHDPGMRARSKFCGQSPKKLIRDRARSSGIPEHIRRAFAVATSGRPGPVVVALPEDVCARRARVR
jgi:acetolactate synthase-1/2/3 large subunit